MLKWLAALGSRSRLGGVDSCFYVTHARSLAQIVHQEGEALAQRARPGSVNEALLKTADKNVHKESQPEVCVLRHVGRAEAVHFTFSTTLSSLSGAELWQSVFGCLQDMQALRSFKVDSCVSS